MKKFKMLLSVVMCLVMCFCMIPFGMLAQAETTVQTIWQADPYLAGKNVGDNINYKGDGYSSAISTNVGKDSEGYYYSIDATKGGYSYVLSGVNGIDKNVVNAIRSYLRFSYEYRITSSAASITGDMFVWACNGWNAQSGRLSFSKLALNSDWTAVTGTPNEFSDSWNGRIAFNLYGVSSFPEDGYKIDIRNVKLQVSSENADAINKALEAAGITTVTYATLTAYEEFVYDPSMDDANSYMIWQAEAGIAGSEGADVTDNAQGYQGFTPAQKTYVAKEDNGYYYSTTYSEARGWSMMKTGLANNSQASLAWLSNAAAIKAILPFAEFRYEYRIVTDDPVTGRTMEFFASNFRHYGLQSFGSTSLVMDGEWHTVSKEGLTWNQTFNWSPSSISVCVNGSGTWPTYSVDLRNVSISIPGTCKVALNKALVAAGITDITFDTITGYVPYEYVNVDTPIWYANPDRSLADRNGDTDVTAELNDDKTIPQLGYTTVVYTDEEEGETFYRTIMACQNGGSHSQNTYFTSGIAAENKGFGWMADANVIAALKPYMYIGYEYRFQSAGNIPSNTTLFMQAANWGSLTKVTTQKVVAGSWQVVEPKRLDANAFSGTTFGSYDAKNWNDGEFMISIYSGTESFSGTQIIDLRNLRVSVPSQYRTKINEALSKVAGIDEIANFTLGVELGTDAKGNKDYFALLSTTEKAIEYDLNDDDIFDLKDFIRMKKYNAYIINYMPEYIIKRADSNLDGILDTVDFAKMRMALLNK